MTWKLYTRKEEGIRGRNFAFQMNHTATININYVRRTAETRGNVIVLSDRGLIL